MLTHHLTTEQILTLKQQNPQLFRQQKRYIRLIAIITAAIFCITFSSLLFWYPLANAC